jgi:hypothetical protein
LFWLTKYDGQAPLCEKMTGGAIVAVVGMGYRGLLDVEGGVGGGELLLAATAAGTATTAVAASPLRQRSTFLDLGEPMVGWQDILVVVRAAAVPRWHDRGWRAYWRWRSMRSRRVGTLLCRSYRP